MPTAGSQSVVFLSPVPIPSEAGEGAANFCSFLQRSLLEWSSSCTFSPSTPSPPSEAASFPPSLSRLFSFCIQSILYTKSKKRIFTYGDWGGGGLVLATNFVYAKLEGGGKEEGTASHRSRGFSLYFFAFLSCLFYFLHVILHVKRKKEKKK